VTKQYAPPPQNSNVFLQNGPYKHRGAAIQVLTSLCQKQKPSLSNTNSSKVSQLSGITHCTLNREKLKKNNNNNNPILDLRRLKQK
jgi:hypothetical protein